MLILFSPFIFPLYLIRFSVFGIPFTVMEVYTYIIGVVFVIKLALKHSKLHFEKPLKSAYFWGGLLLVGATLGTLLAPAESLLPSGELQPAQQVSLGVLKSMPEELSRWRLCFGHLVTKGGPGTVVWLVFLNQPIIYPYSFYRFYCWGCIVCLKEKSMGNSLPFSVA